jgi:hypothetical protein
MSHFINELTILAMKIKVSIGAVLAIILAFLVPIIPLLILVFFAIIADTIFGIYKAYKLKEKITSRKMSQLVSKMLLYQLTIISLFVLEKYLLNEFTSIFTDIHLILTKLGTITLIYIEVVSLNEHIIKLYNISIWKKFKELLGRTKALKDEIDSINNGGEDTTLQPPLL